MSEEQEQSFVMCSVASAFVLAAGALGVVHLGLSLCGLLGALVLMRICWLDDNISNDLLDQTDLPQSYHNAYRRQRLIEHRLTGRPWREMRLTPAIVATRMRAEVELWSVVLFSAGAMMLGQMMPLGVILSLLLSLAGFAVAFRSAGRLADVLYLVERGQTLPRAELLRSPGWLNSARPASRRDGTPRT